MPARARAQIHEGPVLGGVQAPARITDQQAAA